MPVYQALHARRVQNRGGGDGGADSGVGGAGGGEGVCSEREQCFRSGFWDCGSHRWFGVGMLLGTGVIVRLQGYEVSNCRMFMRVNVKYRY